MRPVRLIFILGFALLTLLSTACTAPDNGYPTLQGHNVVLSDLGGKVVFINYWAEWCGPCRAEIPEFNHFAQSHRDEVSVYSVNFDGVSGAALLDQVAALGIEFDTLLADPRGALGAPPSVALPETLVLDRQGNLYTVLVGPQTLEELNAVLLSVP